MTISCTTEYRVRPVTRWVLTRYTMGEDTDGVKVGSFGSLETLGEFDNEGYAKEVARVMGLESHWQSRRTGETGSGQTGPSQD